jgi:5-methylcytosine-specific restriction endonuclease McrA
MPYVKAAVRRYDQQRDQGEQRQFLHSTTWRKIRDAKLARDPLCERHLVNGDVVAAVLVHHIDGNELNNRDENHQSLCNDCHEELERGGRFGRVARANALEAARGRSESLERARS